MSYISVIQNSKAKVAMEIWILSFEIAGIDEYKSIDSKKISTKEAWQNLH